jgi:purine-binding chemotaxis protein CheW
MADFSARLLLVRVADVVAALEATAVREILSTQAATRIPGAPAAVQGLINVRGELVTLVRGAQLLGREGVNEAGATLVLLRWGGTSVAMAVDAVVDLVAVGDARLTAREDLPGIDPSIVKAVGVHGDRSFLVLDLDALLRPLLVA